MFGAGLQLTEVFRPEPSQFQEFWTALQDIKLRLYGSPVPLIAAINVRGLNYLKKETLLYFIKSSNY